MKERKKEDTNKKKDHPTTTATQLIGTIVTVFKKVSDECLDERFKLEQAFNDFGDYHVTAMRFVTGINPPEVYWFEVVFVWVEKLDRDKYNEILMNVQEWKPFKYHNSYDKFYGRIVYIVPEKIKGIFPPKLVKKGVHSDYKTYRTFERTLYVVLNTKMREEKVLAVGLAYLVNYFANRAVALESAIFNEKKRKVNVWRRVRQIFNGTVCGKDARLSSSLYLLYNNIYYRVEFLEEQGRIGEHLAKTIKLLTKLFFIFAKKFDVYASKVYAWVVSTHLYKMVKEKVGFQNVSVFAENIKKIWEMAKEFIVHLEIRKVLGVET